MSDKTDIFIRCSDAAVLLGYKDPDSLKDWIKRGCPFRTRRVGPNNMLMVSKVDVHRYLEQQTMPAVSASTK